MIIRTENKTSFSADIISHSFIEPLDRLQRHRGGPTGNRCLRRIGGADQCFPVRVSQASELDDDGARAAVHDLD